jgi:hypothetical protein
MIDRHCLIIDNEDQSHEIEGIIRNGKPKGINIICHQFNVGSTSREDLLNDAKNIDIAKVVATFNNEFKGIAFNLMAFDWDLSDPNINGIELIRQFQANDLRKNTPKLLYSGVLKEQIGSMLNEFKENKRTEKTVINWLNALIKTPIMDFIDRPEYANSIVSILEKSNDSLEFAIESELRKLKDCEFKSVFPEFEGRKFGEIADLIESENVAGNRFKRELVNQIISYLTNINVD